MSDPPTDTPPPLDYATPDTPRRKRRVWIGGVCLAGLLLAVSLLIPRMNRSHSHPPWVRCSSNLRQLALAMKMYANDNAGAFPPGWLKLADADLLTSDVFVCPVGYPMITKATGPTTRMIAEGIADPAQRHCSYIYAAGGLNENTVGADEVLAFEWPPDATDGSATVMLGDAHVERLDAGPGRPDQIKYWNLQEDYVNGVRPLKLRP